MHSVLNFDAQDREAMIEEALQTQLIFGLTFVGFGDAAVQFVQTQSHLAMDCHQ